MLPRGTSFPAPSVPWVSWLSSDRRLFAPFSASVSTRPSLGCHASSLSCLLSGRPLMDIGLIGVQMSSSQDPCLNYLCKDPHSKEGHILRSQVDISFGGLLFSPPQHICQEPELRIDAKCQIELTPKPVRGRTHSTRILRQTIRNGNWDFALLCLLGTRDLWLLALASLFARSSGYIKRRFRIFKQKRRSLTLQLDSPCLPSTTRSWWSCQLGALDVPAFSPRLLSHPSCLLCQVEAVIMAF